MNKCVKLSDMIPIPLTESEYNKSYAHFKIQQSSGIKYVTGYGKTDHFAHNFKIELLVFKGSVDLKQ